MAKYTLAQVSERLLSVQAHLRAGLSAKDACKAADLSPGTYKRWLETYKTLDLPSFVLPAPFHGGVALSHDGRWIFTVADTDEGFSLTRYDAATGATTAHARVENPRAPGTWRVVLAVGAAHNGSRALFLVSGGAMYAWDEALGRVSACEHDLRDKGAELNGRASSSTRRWAYASISPDLSRVAYWTTEDRSVPDAKSTLHVRSLDDDAEVMRYSTEALFGPSAIVFHPTRPLLGVLCTNKLITVLDFAQRSVRVEKGPQSHGLSFCTGDTLLHDDWYGCTQMFDYVTGEQKNIGRGWGSIASQSDRFVTASPTQMNVRNLQDPESIRQIAFEGIQEVMLSVDGTRLLAWTDQICVWVLDGTKT